MSENLFVWELKEEERESVKKYCNRCKKEVEFYDSMVRRHNANGKNIYQYAIYKCSKGHTWNKNLNKYNASQANDLNEIDMSYATSYLKESNYRREEVKESIKKIAIKPFKKDFEELKIVIRGGTDIRLDRLLAERLIDVSRNVIQVRIKEGKVLVNQKIVKPKNKINDGDIITIKL